MTGRILTTESRDPGGDSGVCLLLFLAAAEGTKLLTAKFAKKLRKGRKEKQNRFVL